MLAPSLLLAFSASTPRGVSHHFAALAANVTLDALIGPAMEAAR